MRRDLLFETSRFNLSEVKAHFINPCCFGEDSAPWLRGRLLAMGFEATAPAQEDWGWYVEVKHKGGWYFIGVGGNAVEAGRGDNRGEWRVMVEKRRTVWEKLTGGGGAAEAGEVADAVWRILKAEADFTNLRRE